MSDKFVTINTHGDWEEVTWSGNDTPETAPPIVMALITPKQLAEYKNLRELILDYADDRVEESEAVVIKRLDYEQQQKEIDHLRNENAALRRKIIELCNEKK